MDNNFNPNANINPPINTAVAPAPVTPPAEPVYAYNSNSQEQQPKKFPIPPKIIFIILGAVVLIEVIFTIKALIAPLPGSTPPANQAAAPSAVGAKAGKISLVASKPVFRVGETVPVSVIVDTGGSKLAGADVLVSFDPKMLEATAAGLIKKKMFDEYPLLSVDQEKGLVSISGIKSSKAGFAGTGQFALINFTAKTAGKASLAVGFKKGSTTQSNLIEANTAKNILEQVGNLAITIQ